MSCADEGCRQLIRGELIRSGMLKHWSDNTPMPPWDRDAEECIASEALHGHMPPTWFDPRWCFSQFHAAVVVSMQSLSESGYYLDGVPVDEVCQVLDSCGLPGHALRDQVVALAQVPFCASVDIMCERVRVHWRRRQALAQLQALEAMLRQPATPGEQLVASAERVLEALQGAACRSS